LLGGVAALLAGWTLMGVPFAARVLMITLPSPARIPITGPLSRVGVGLAQYWPGQPRA
jgi:hypothetical protein